MTDDNIESISSIIDTTALDELESIMEDEFANILQVFLEESVTLMSEIHVGFDEESEHLKRTVHTLKSCSRNVGAMRLGSIAETMEELLLKEDIMSAKSYLDELQDVFMQSHVLIKKCMQDKLHEVA